MRLDSARKLWPILAGSFLLLAIPAAVWAQDAGDAAGAAGAGMGMLLGCGYLIIVLLAAAGAWKVFVKAGKPGWAAIVPIYNGIVLLEIVGRPLWWILLLLAVPLVNVVIYIMVLVDLAKSFGQGAGYALGLLMLPFIFWPMLGFGDATYQGPVAATV